MLEPIPHHALREEHLPHSDAPWATIVRFASTFNAYRQLADEKAAGDAANRKARDLATCTLTDLRAALFFEYRRYNHFGHAPDAVAMVHMHALVEEIGRAHV